MSKTEELKALFEEWKDCHANESGYLDYHNKEKGACDYIPKENFVCDGIMDELKFNEAQIKILYIAKECNLDIRRYIETDPENFWAKKEVEKCERYEKCEKHEKCKGWFDCCKSLKTSILKGILMLNNAIINNDYSKPNKEHPTSLLNVAFMNLNKRGGLENSEFNSLEGYVKKYKDKISEEIRIIDPDIIVCCGEDVKKLVNKNSLAEAKVKVVWAYHPSYICSNISKLEKLKENIEEAGIVIDTKKILNR